MQIDPVHPQRLWKKTEKALEQYKFMQWMDGFIQPRDGRTNLKMQVKRMTKKIMKRMKDIHQAR